MWRYLTPPGSLIRSVRYVSLTTLLKSSSRFGGPVTGMYARAVDIVACAGGFSRFSVDIQLRNPRISVEVDPVGGRPTNIRTHSSNKTNARDHGSSLLDAPQGPLGTTRRQEDGHPSTRSLGGVYTVDRVVAGGSGCGVLLFGVGVCLFLSPSLLAMLEPGRILDSRRGCVADNRLRRV